MTIAQHLILGKRGEEEAIKFLVEKNYTILEKNWRCKKSKSEIDIIASKDNILVIIEVKTREKDIFQLPEEAVNKKKVSLLILLANIYAEENQIQKEIRFDVISIVLNKTEIKIKHIINAFEPNF